MNKFAVLGLSKADQTVTYEASFWEGPEAAGETGRYVRTRCTAKWIPGIVLKTERGDVVRPGRPLSVSPGVSYYSDLLKAFAKIGCRP